jgi:hypothetical protein
MAYSVGVGGGVTISVGLDSSSPEIQSDHPVNNLNWALLAKRGVYESTTIIPILLRSTDTGGIDAHHLPPMFYNADRFVVDNSIREIVERLEGTRHQFIPISIEDENGQLIKRQFYWFNIIGIHRIVKDIKISDAPPAWLATVPRELMPTEHCWRDFYSLSTIFISDEVFELLPHDKIINLRFGKLEEI